MPEPKLTKDSLLIRECRRMLMQSLNSFFPARVYVKTLYRTIIGIDPTYEKTLFVKDIYYLKAKGYIELKESPLAKNSKVEEQFILLTAQGKEIAEQTMTDPALEF